MTFKLTNDFYHSHCMDSADKVSQAKLTALLGKGEGECDGKSADSWSGEFTTSTGEVIQVSCWDWKGSLAYCGSVSIWCGTQNKQYIAEWKKYLEDGCKNKLLTLEKANRIKS